MQLRGEVSCAVGTWTFSWAVGEEFELCGASSTLSIIRSGESTCKTGGRAGARELLCGSGARDPR